MRMSLCLLAGILAAGATFATTESVLLEYKKINGFTVKYVTINMNDPDVVVAPALAEGFPNRLEGWSSFLYRLQPDAAINGTYFCPHSCMPVGDIAVEGNWLYTGVVGTAMCITPGNRVVMRPGPHQQKPNWTGFRSVLCAGPRLLTDGQVTVNARAEGFRDPHVLGSASRSAIAWRSDGILIFLTIHENISLRNLAYVCLHLGAVDAMSLDGGNSSALYADGHTVTRPGRGLSNLLVVYSSRKRYEQFARELVPTQVPLLANLLTTTPPLALSSIPSPMNSIPMNAVPLNSTPTTPVIAPNGIVRITQLDKSQPVRGMVPVMIEVSKGHEVNWTTLRINGSLRAMGNVWPLQYDWDSTKEKDGMHQLEVTAWSDDHRLVSRDICTVEVRNSQQVAQR